MPRDFVLKFHERSIWTIHWSRESALIPSQSSLTTMNFKSPSTDFYGNNEYHVLPTITNNHHAIFMVNHQAIWFINMYFLLHSTFRRYFLLSLKLFGSWRQVRDDQDPCLIVGNTPHKPKSCWHVHSWCARCWCFVLRSADISMVVTSTHQPVLLVQLFLVSIVFHLFYRILILVAYIHMPYK